MGSILVAEEKHGTWYWPASTDEELSKSALTILTQRYEQGYWYHDPEILDNETLKFRPKDLVETHLGESWPGWDVDEQVRSEAINAHSKEIREKYGDDQDILDLKLKGFKNAVSEYKYRRGYREWYAEMKELVESQDTTRMVTFKNGRKTPLSWIILSDRGDHEYERVELEDLQEV